MQTQDVQDSAEATVRQVLDSCRERAIGNNAWKSSESFAVPISALSYTSIPESSASSTPRLGVGPLRPIFNVDFGVSTAGSARSGSTPKFTQANERPGRENAVLTAMRRQMEALEGKLSGQISRAQQQTDRLHCVALSRVDDKMGNMEAVQPKVERQLAELTGLLKGLSDEMHAQVRRIDQMDERLWEWRNQQELGARAKFAEFEQAFLKLQTSIRLEKSAQEELAKKLYQALRDMESQHLNSEEIDHSLQSLHLRLQDLENVGGNIPELATMSPWVSESQAKHATIAPNVDDVGQAIVTLKARLCDAFQQMENLVSDTRDTHTKVETHEQRLNTMRIMLERKEEQLRQIHDRFERSDWDGRFKEVQTQINNCNQTRTVYEEMLEVLQRKFENLEQTQDCLMGHFRRGHDRAVAPPPPAKLDYIESVAMLGEQTVEDKLMNDLEVKGCVMRLDGLENKMSSLKADIEAIRTGTDFALESFVDTIKDMVAKVRDHEECLKYLMEQLGKLQVLDKMSMAKIDVSSITARIRDSDN